MHTDAVDKRLRHVAQSLETADAFAGGCPARGLEATWLVFVVVRIFFAAPATAHQGALPSSTLWHANLYQPLVDLGHDVVVFDFDYSEFNRNLDPSDPKQRAFTAENRPRFSEQLIKQFDDAHARAAVDLFFSYFYSSYVEPEAIRDIGAAGPVTVNWYCNASYQFALVREIAPAYNYCLVPERFRLDDYRAAGATPIYCQEAANPQVYRPYELPRTYDVAFVGQRYGDRGVFLRRLIDAGVDARAWGPHWDEPPPVVRPWRRVAGRTKRALLRQPEPPFGELPADHCGPPLGDLEYIQMYSRSAISLGFTKVASFDANGSALKQVRLRDFEATMSGAFYLVEECDELNDFFEPNREIVCFSDPDELVEKARYYLDHDADRERISLAGLLRARAEHTWHGRFRKVFSEIGLA
jgi:spore maturation protein CgeB